MSQLARRRAGADPVETSIDGGGRTGCSWLRSWFAPGLILALVTPFGGCGSDGTGPGGNVTLTEPFEYEQDATGAGSFRIIGVNGDIRVSGMADDDSVRVTGTRRVQGCSDSRAQQAMQSLEVRVITVGSEILVQTVQPSNTSPCTLTVDYEVTAPRRLAAGIVDVHGSIDVTGLGQGISVTSVNGLVALEDVQGETVVRLTNGNVTADVGIEGNEEIDLLTVNGNLDLTVPTSTDAFVSAVLVNGTISVHGLTLSDVATTQNTLTGVLGAGEGRIVLQTTNGLITLKGRS